MYVDIHSVVTVIFAVTMFVAMVAGIGVLLLGNSTLEPVR